MRPIEHFQFCPRCGQPVREGAAQAAAFACGACGFRYFFNAAAAVAAFVRRGDGRWLFIRRAQDPGQGKLAPAGGFIDLGETAEAAVRREFREELGIELGPLSFLCSGPNTYLYREVTYPTLDLFFVTAMMDGAEPRALEGGAGFDWFEAADVRPEDLAFPSMQAAWRSLQKQV